MREELDIEELLPLANELVSALQNNNKQQASAIVEKITNKPNFDIILEIGKVVKKSNTALKDLYSEEVLNEIRNTPQMKKPKSLDEIITLADKAANDTLDGMKSCNQIAKQISSHIDQLEIVANQHSVDKRQVDDYLTLTRQAIEQLTKIYSEVSVAQSFQDLLGQSLRADISTILDIQSDLVSIIRLAQESLGEEILEEDYSTEESKSEDDDIDQLLSDLGL